jgi:hypothetical protein
VIDHVLAPISLRVQFGVPLLSGTGAALADRLLAGPGPAHAERGTG